MSCVTAWLMLRSQGFCAHVMRDSIAAVRLVAGALLLIGTLTTADAKPLRVVSWNIANLASGPGVALRGYQRTSADYAVLQNIIRTLDPDIIALQEIGSLPAARMVLGDGYAVAFESRCLANPHRCEADNDDIYTAIAYKTALAGSMSVFQLDQLAIAHRDECGVERQVRGGVGVRMVLKGQSVWIPSLHLKASCKTGAGTRGETADDCATQRAQFQMLRDWINGLPKDDAVILTGDFNRRLLKTGDVDVRQTYFDAYPRPRMFLPSGDRACWSRRDSGVDLRDEAHKRAAFAANPDYDRQGLVPFLYDPWAQRDIDFFVIENLAPERVVASRQVPMTGHYQLRNIGKATLRKCDGSVKATGRSTDLRSGESKPSALAFSEAYPSDHCPIVLDLAQ